MIYQRGICQQLKSISVAKDARFPTPLVILIIGNSITGA